MINLIGEHSCKVDAKGRVMFPSSFKKTLAPILEKGFVLKQSIFDACLELYTMDGWNDAIKDVNQLSRYNKKNNNYRRAFFAGTKLIELDGAGRFLIPKNLCEYAHIKKEVVMISVGGCIEIWNKEAFNDNIGAAAENFEQMTEELLGGVKNDGDE